MLLLSPRFGLDERDVGESISQGESFAKSEKLLSAMRKAYFKKALKLL